MLLPLDTLSRYQTFIVLLNAAFKAEQQNNANNTVWFDLNRHWKFNLPYAKLERIPLHEYKTVQLINIR